MGSVKAINLWFSNQRASEEQKNNFWAWNGLVDCVGGERL